MNKYILLLLFDLLIMILACITAIILITLEDEPAKLIIIYQNKKKIFKSINQIKKDVGAAAFESVTQFECDSEKIINLLYPNCKIIKNTLL